MMYVSQIIMLKKKITMLFTLKSYSAVCLLYLSETGRIENDPLCCIWGERTLHVTCPQEYLHRCPSSRLVLSPVWHISLSCLVGPFSGLCTSVGCHAVLRYWTHHHADTFFPDSLCIFFSLGFWVQRFVLNRTQGPEIRAHVTLPYPCFLLQSLHSHHISSSSLFFFL